MGIPSQSSPGNQLETSLPPSTAVPQTLPATHAEHETATAPTIPAESVLGPSRPASDALVGCVLGDFRVGTLLGRGGMGAVYRGRQESLDRDVAIKVLPPHLSDNEGFRSRFQLEAKAVASLDSPHIIKVYGAGEAHGHHWFAMEYVEGHDLAQTIRREGRPSRQTALGWVLQAARGLQAAGDLGIIHRDIKPANMMLTKRGMVKIMDFGLVRTTKEAQGLTMTGTVMGTVSYFSPEQGRGERCDCRTDLYALGVMFYEFLTGRLPFTGEDPTSIIYQHIHVAPTPPREVDPSIPVDFQSVVLKCLQKRAEDRYQTAAELVADLERLTRGVHPDINPAEKARLLQGTTLYLPGKRPGRRLAPWILAGTSVTIAAATSVWLAKSSPVPAPAAPAVVASPAPIAPNPGPVPHQILTVPVPVVAAPPEPLRQPQQPAAQPDAPAIVVVQAKPAPPVAVDPVVIPTVTQPVVPGPETAMAAAGIATLTKRIQDLAANGQYGEARTLLAGERTAQPANPDLAPLSAVIDQAEGAALLARSRSLVARGDLVAATEPLTKAHQLLGNTPAVTAATEERQQRIADVEHLAAEATSLALSGHGDEALASLSKAQQLAPAWPAVTTAESAIGAELARQAAVRAKRDAALTAGTAAFAAGDLAAADLAYAQAQEAEPENLAAATGRQQVAERQQAIARQRQLFANAITAKDLPGAERALAALTSLVPAAAIVAPAAEVAGLKTRLAEEARLAAELEAKRVAWSARIIATAKDPAVPFSAVESDLAAFVADTGGKRPEQQALDAAVDDRRQREAVIARLRDLDRAVLAGDGQTIRAIVTDAAHANALTSLAKQQDLVFATTLTAFTRSGERGTATLKLRNGFATFPETTLPYRCELARTAAGWTITAAHPEP